MRTRQGQRGRVGKRNLISVFAPDLGDGGASLNPLTIPVPDDAPEGTAPKRTAGEWRPKGLTGIADALKFAFVEDQRPLAIRLRNARTTRCATWVFDLPSGKYTRRERDQQRQELVQARLAELRAVMPDVQAIVAKMPARAVECGERGCQRVGPPRVAIIVPRRTPRSIDHMRELEERARRLCRWDSCPADVVEFSDDWTLLDESGRPVHGGKRHRRKLDLSWLSAHFEQLARANDGLELPPEGGSPGGSFVVSIDHELRRRKAENTTDRETAPVVIRDDETRVEKRVFPRKTCWFRDFAAQGVGQLIYDQC